MRYRIVWWLRDGKLRVRHTLDQNLAEYMVETLIKNGVSVAHITRMEQ